jgi:hypothetical protein
MLSHGESKEEVMSMEDFKRGLITLLVLWGLLFLLGSAAKVTASADRAKLEPH